LEIVGSPPQTLPEPQKGTKDAAWRVCVIVVKVCMLLPALHGVIIIPKNNKHNNINENSEETFATGLARDEKILATHELFRVPHVAWAAA
jgi:hypothetical protein